jgi:hydrogenase maturation factor HypF (carbamoyltransferase family)
MTWKKLDNDRKHRILSSGLTIIIPTKNDEVIPISCPVCNVFFSSNLDMRAYQNSQCCCYCETKYAYTDRDNWLDGHRPPRQDIIKDLKERKLLKIEIIF